MPRKIDSRQTTTSYWQSVIDSVGHPKYAVSSVFEEGPEYAKGGADSSYAVFNKACAFQLQKVFNPNLNVWDSVGDSIAAQITAVLLNRVGRNRTYRELEMKLYLAEAGVRYAALQMIKNALKVSTMVPRIAQLLTDPTEWKDLYDRYYNTNNINFPLPEHLAKYIDEYVVGIYEDKNDDFNKGLVVFTNQLEVYSRIDSTTRTFRVVEGGAGSIAAVQALLDATPASYMTSIARDMASFVKTKPLTKLDDVTIYPLDAKHRCTIINMAKFNVLGVNSPDESAADQQGDDMWGAGPAPTCEYIPGSSNLKLAKDAKADNINYWDAVGAAVPVSRDTNSMQNLRCIQGIQSITLRVHDGSDEEQYKGSLCVGVFGSTNESDWVDEAQGLINYQDLFGGWSLLAGTPGALNNTGYIYENTVEAFGTESVCISEKQLDAIKLIALQEVFNLMINTKKSEESDD